MPKHQSAFPIPEVARGAPGLIKEATNRGMTLRDYFAAAALPAIVAEYQERIDTDPFNSKKPASYAAKAYEWADALIAARGDDADS